jgi:hypothetical protein
MIPLTIVFDIVFLFVFCILSGCAENSLNSKSSFYVKNKNISSGENISIYFDEPLSMKEEYLVSLIDSQKQVIRSYVPVVEENRLVLTRLSLLNTTHYSKYRLLISTENFSQEIDIETSPSIVIKSLCGIEDCTTLSGNVVASIPQKIVVKTHKLISRAFTYKISTPNNSYEVTNDYETATNIDYLNNIVFEKVPEGLSYYVALIEVSVISEDNSIIRNILPVKVVRPLEVKHTGEVELAEVYEPVPVTGCIPGSVGNNVQYSESTSETRQNSVSVNINNSWSDSMSSTLSETESEGINVSETQGTMSSSSLSNSETQSDAYTVENTDSNTNNISYNSNDGETWSWNIVDSNTQGNSSTDTSGSSTGVDGSVTTGFSGEGSLPFLAKASGKVEVSAGVNASWNNSSTDTDEYSNTNSRGYTTSGTSQNGRSFGSIQNESRSHSLTGIYVLSSSTTSVISDSTSLSSGRVWNMSASKSSGKVVTQGNSQSIAETVVNSSSSSTTFSYSGYIPRGRFGTFFRQTTRYVKLSEIISYDMNGFSSHAGYLMMNTWAWAPELTIGTSCKEAMQNKLPKSECFIPPCGE